MSESELLNARQCSECGQVTMTRHWQEVNFCANCGVERDSTEADRQTHLAVGIAISADEMDLLADDEEIALTRALDNDRQLTLHLRRAPP